MVMECPYIRDGYPEPITQLCLISVMIFTINPSPNPQPGEAGDAIRLVFHPKFAQHCCLKPTSRTKDPTGLAFGNTKVRKPLHSHRR